MIDLGMIEWIVNIIRAELHSLSEYSLEYATALLMNLTLRTVGKNACENPNLQVLHLLNDLLEHENFQIRTYVNGTLYSLFSRASLKEEAKALGMDSFLSELMKTSDQQYQRQIQYILKQLIVPEEEQDREDSDTMSNEEEDNDEDRDTDEEDEYEDESCLIEEDYQILLSERGEDFLINNFQGDQEVEETQIEVYNQYMALEREKQKDIDLSRRDEQDDDDLKSLI